MDILDDSFLNHTKMLRKRSIIRALALIFFIFTFIMGIHHIYEHHSITTLGMVLLFNSFLSLSNISLLASHKISDQYASYLITFPLFLMMLYLIATGGVDNTGFIWIFIVPIVFLYLHGLKSGLILLSIFLLSISLILFMPEHILLTTHYSFALKIRIILVFLLAILLASVYEYFNEMLFNQIKHMTHKLDHLANEDQLTQIYNRRGILNFIELSKQHHITPYSLILCDIDYFKKFNDTYGHEIGDKVLIHIATIIKNTIETKGVVARWGGEEFLIFLPKADEIKTYLMAKEIRQKVISTPITLDNKELKVTLSMGYTVAFSIKTDIDTLIKEADKYMYEAKKTGRDTIKPIPA